MSLDQVLQLVSAKQIRSIVEAQARINLWHGSVRSGKTIASLIRWLIYVSEAPTTGELIVVGRTRDSIARNVFAPLQNPEIFGTLASQVHYTNGAATATILGRTVHIIGANDAKAEPKIRGLTCAGAYVDEASTLPRDFFDQLVARCSVPGAKIFATTNPDNPGHWLRKEYLLRPAQTGLRAWHFKLADNIHLDQTYIDTITSTYTGLFYKRSVLGLWVQAEGAVYDSFDPDVHVVDTVPTITRWLSLGIDYGTSNPFAGLLLGLGIDRKLYLTREFRYESKKAHRQLTDVEYSERLRAWLADVPVPGTELRGVVPEAVVIDPSALSFRVQLQHDGLASRLASNTVYDGIRNVSSLLATRRLLVHRSCTGLIEEFPGYSWDPDYAEKGEDVPIKAEDHSLDAARYAVHSTRQQWRHEIVGPELLAA
ncbi:PBSX family phage terminase large subunit [Nonomuraea sp. NPDC050328]|uniref:PBSX family phage terminase large subunit n=1 Tax=Nonomuraea sp. NPDC050328 TaxID=3364361 RepID=UPI0037A911F8